MKGKLYLNAVRRGLPDTVVTTGFWLLMAFLAVAGVRCGQQMAASSGCGPWRRRLVLFAVGPLIFVSSVLVALVATYWLLQAQALATGVLGEGERPTAPGALSPTCNVRGESIVCQVLLSARTDLAIGAIRQVDIDWRDLTRRGAYTTVSLWQQASQVQQLAPRVDPGGFWTLRAKEPLPFAFQIATPDACRRDDQISLFQATRSADVRVAASAPGRQAHARLGNRLWAAPADGRRSMAADLDGRVCRRDVRHWTRGSVRATSATAIVLDWNAKP